MKTFLHILFGVALCLAVLVSTAPATDGSIELVPYNITTNADDPVLAGNAGYDPSYDYHGDAVVEVWIGQTAVNAGNVLGTDLYNAAHDVLDNECGPSHTTESHTQNDWTRVAWETNYPGVRPGGPTGRTGMKIERGMWANGQIRDLLISIVASTLEATTNNPNNCILNEGVKYCVFGDIVRVNMPTYNGNQNSLQVRLFGDIMMDAYFSSTQPECCEIRSLVDSMIDGYGDSIKGIYQQYSRNARCISKAGSSADQIAVMIGIIFLLLSFSKVKSYLSLQR